MAFVSIEEFKETFSIDQLENYIPFLDMSEQYEELSHIGNYPYVDMCIRKFLFNVLSDDINKDYDNVENYQRIYNFIRKRYSFDKCIKLERLLDKKYGNWLTNPNHPITIDDRDILKSKLNEFTEKMQKKYKDMDGNSCLNRGFEFNDYKVIYITDLLMRWASTENKKYSFFDAVRELFTFSNNTEMHNLYGYLGLILIDLFFKYYKNNNVKEYLYLIVVIDRLYHLDLYEAERNRQYVDMYHNFMPLKQKAEKHKQNCSKAGSTTKNEGFKRYCIDFYHNNIVRMKSRRQVAIRLAEYYQEYKGEVLKKFPETNLSDEDPFNTIYKWLQKI